VSSWQVHRPAEEHARPERPSVPVRHGEMLVSQNSGFQFAPCRPPPVAARTGCQSLLSPNSSAAMKRCRMAAQRDLASAVLKTVLTSSAAPRTAKEAGARPRTGPFAAQATPVVF